MSRYDADFHAWANEQAALLRAGRVDQADITNIAEELESMGRGERRERTSRLTVLLIHLLNWQHQPDRGGSSWQAAIRIQRRSLAGHLRDNPSLKARVHEAVDEAYGTAVIAAAAETGLPESRFPDGCPWTVAHIFDPGFWPAPGPD